MHSIRHKSKDFFGKRKKMRKKQAQYCQLVGWGVVMNTKEASSKETKNFKIMPKT